MDWWTNDLLTENPDQVIGSGETRRFDVSIAPLLGTGEVAQTPTATVRNRDGLLAVAGAAGAPVLVGASAISVVISGPALEVGQSYVVTLGFSIVGIAETRQVAFLLDVPF